ncbi:MAG: hypothetical protein CL693_08555 [Cellvibrionaceae bacterium]|nr:hypothetical protein [Cellvibrionaceae bacterium]
MSTFFNRPVVFRSRPYGVTHQFAVASLSTDQWRAFALEQQRLRWLECGSRITLRMQACGAEASVREEISSSAAG